MKAEIATRAAPRVEISKGTLRMPDPMPPIDYMGPQGGMLAMAFAAGAVATAGLFSGIGALFWRLFGDKRIKALEADIVSMKAEQTRSMEAIKAEHIKSLIAERHRCDEEIDQLRTQVTQLQTILIANGNANMRQAVQASISEIRVSEDR